MADSRSDDMGTAAAAERELTLTPAQALALAIERYRLDELDDAEMIYAALLERWTDRPDVLNYMGVPQHQRGENGAALALLRHAVEVAPDTALAPWRPGRLHRRSLARGRPRQPSLAPPRPLRSRAHLPSIRARRRRLRSAADRRRRAALGRPTSRARLARQRVPGVKTLRPRARASRRRDRPCLRSRCREARAA